MLTSSLCTRPRRALLARISAALAIVIAASLFAFPPASRGQQGLSPFGLPQKPASTPKPAAPAPAPVIARIAGRDITQADFDRVAQPYFKQLKDQLGSGFQGDMRKLATFNVFDELVRRQLLAIECERQQVVVTQGEIDAILRLDPYFLTNGRFDPVKLNDFKTNPGSNYLQVLPRVREVAATAKLDESIRKGLSPTPAQVQAEWAQRTDQVRFKVLPLLTRDMSLEPEATEAECHQYYRAHPDEFTRRTRVRLRYVRLPLPVAGDSTHAAELATAIVRATAIADSLTQRTLPDSAAELADTGPFDLPAATIPGLGLEPALGDSIGRIDRDSSLRVVGPYVAREAVIVGVVTERQPKHLLPLRDVLGDVKRRADTDKRRIANDAERRAFWEANRDRWRGPRASLTRVTLNTATIAAKPPLPEEADRWYAQHGRSLFGVPDSSGAWLPPITDSLRTVVRTRMTAERRRQLLADATSKILLALRISPNIRQAARLEGAVAETLTLARYAGPDTLFNKPFEDSLLASAMVEKGAVHGPRAFGAYDVAWRIDAVDTSYVPAYELVRGPSDQQFAEDRRRKDEVEGRAHFELHRADFQAPLKYALDYVAVRIPPPDSVRIPEAEIRRRYDEDPATYRREEQAKARHILFMTRGLAPEQERIAKARADSLLAAIRKNGGDFAELAKRFSQEPGAPAGGGDLGWFGHGRMVKEFEAAAFALKPGEISPVVKTQFGYHIIKVEERKPAGMKSFAEVRGEIRTQMAQSRGDSTARRSAEALRRRLVLGGDANILAAPYGGVVAATPIAGGEVLPAIGFVQALAQDLPGMKPGKWTQGTYRAGNLYVVLRLRETLPPRPAEFDEVKARAIEEMKNAKRRELLKQKMETIRSGLAAGASIDSLAAPYGGLKDSGLLPRTMAFVPMVGNEPRVVQRAFTMKPGEVTDTLQVAQGVIWIRAEEKQPGDPAVFKTASAQITAEMIKKKYEAWIEEKKKSVKIEILRPDLRGPRPSMPGAMTTGR